MIKKLLKKFKFPRFRIIEEKDQYGNCRYSCQCQDGLEEFFFNFWTKIHIVDVAQIAYFIDHSLENQSKDEWCKRWNATLSDDYFYYKVKIQSYFRDDFFYDKEKAFEYMRIWKLIKEYENEQSVIREQKKKLESKFQKNKTFSV